MVTGFRHYPLRMELSTTATTVESGKPLTITLANHLDSSDYDEIRWKVENDENAMIINSTEIECVVVPLKDGRFSIVAQAYKYNSDLYKHVFVEDSLPLFINVSTNYPYQGQIYVEQNIFDMPYVRSSEPPEIYSLNIINDSELTDYIVTVTEYGHQYPLPDNYGEHGSRGIVTELGAVNPDNIQINADYPGYYLYHFEIKHPYSDEIYATTFIVGRVLGVYFDKYSYQQGNNINTCIYTTYSFEKDHAQLTWDSSIEDPRIVVSIDHPEKPRYKTNCIINCAINQEVTLTVNIWNGHENVSSYEALITV